MLTIAHLLFLHSDSSTNNVRLYSLVYKPEVEFIFVSMILGDGPQIDVFVMEITLLQHSIIRAVL